MQRAFLHLLRGPDGRSLARALAFLLLINAFVGGFHGGMLALAADGNGPVICAFGAAQQKAAGGSGQEHLPACCVLGCLGIATTPVADIAVPLLPQPPARVAEVVTPAPSGIVLSTDRLIRPQGPRGPPRIA